MISPILTACSRRRHSVIQFFFYTLSLSIFKSKIGLVHIHPQSHVHRFNYLCWQNTWHKQPKEERVILAYSQRAQSTVIWLHVLGQNMMMEGTPDGQVSSSCGGQEPEGTGTSPGTYSSNEVLPQPSKTGLPSDDQVPKTQPLGAIHTQVGTLTFRRQCSKASGVYSHACCR